MIKLFTKQNCPNCITMKRAFENKDISFIEIDVMKDDQYKKLFDVGITNLPAAYMDGEYLTTDDLIKFIRSK